MPNENLFTVPGEDTLRTALAKVFPIGETSKVLARKLAEDAGSEFSPEGIYRWVVLGCDKAQIYILAGLLIPKVIKTLVIDETLRDAALSYAEEFLNRVGASQGRSGKSECDE